jgi:hypothetical protein
VQWRSAFTGESGSYPAPEPEIDYLRRLDLLLPGEAEATAALAAIPPERHVCCLGSNPFECHPVPAFGAIDETAWLCSHCGRESAP